MKRLSAETEIWKPIDDWPYEVSNLGSVRRTGSAPGARVGRILKPSGYPYLHVNLWKNGTSMTVDVHVLVAVAFIGRKPLNQEVNHKDHNKRNNHAANLEYTTSSGNKLHAVGSDDYVAPNAKLTEDDVRFARASSLPPTELAQKLGVTVDNIYYILRGDTWKNI